MNPNKFCFVLTGHVPAVIEEMQRYIDALEVPEDCEVETIVMPVGLRRAEACQQAMKRTDAKYKIYIAEGVFPIHRRMLSELMEKFRSNPKLGILGIAGAAYVPIAVDWRKAVERFGAYIERTGNSRITHLPPSANERIVPAQILSGYFLATQYDVDWDTGLPDDALIGEAQTLRFIQAGYQAGIPRSTEPWCLVDASWADQDQHSEQTRKWVMWHYAEAAFPKVSVLIPTYNRPDMFEQALKSVLEQTYRNLEIIIGDDSTNDLTEERIRPYLEQDPRIIYIRNEQNLGQFENDLKLMRLAKSDFINFLMDDDLFEPQKIERMMAYMLDDREEKIALVTSYRRLIDDEGRLLPDATFNRQLFENDTLVSGVELGNLVLRYNWNCIGEPTTPLFRKKLLQAPFGTLSGRKYHCNVDIASWLNLLQNHDAVYIAQPLSRFRIHGEQQQYSPRMRLGGVADYAHSLLSAPSFGYLENAEEYREALGFCLKMGRQVLDQFSAGGHPELVGELEELLEQVNERYGQLLNPGQEENIHIRGIEDETRFSDFEPAERERICREYQLDEKHNIYISKHAPKINYADGSEQYLFEVFQKVEHISPDGSELYPFIKDWASKYHLTPVRSNLLDVLQPVVSPDADVLELGGGMGAVTWALAERFRTVDVIEGSPYRARVNRLRNKEHDNVRVFVDDLNRCSFPKKKYGLVTLIGVMEYLPYYAKSKDPYATCRTFLTGLCDYLEEDGVLMIAIENKLGIKYFAGCAEDHNGTLFSGLHGYPERSPITFSRAELERLLEESGYANIQFYHCFPDYKLPKTIIRECDEMYEWDLAPLVRGLYQDQAYRREYLMHDALLADTFGKARLLHEFSNSFLVLCSKSKDKKLSMDPVITRFWNSENVKSIFHHKIDFYIKDGKKQIVRTPLYGNKPEAASGKALFKLNNESYVEGSSMIIEAYRALFRADKYHAIANILKEVREALLAQFSLGQTDEEGYTLVEANAIDFCLNNLVRRPDGLITFIDRKWSFHEPIPEDYVLFRSLHGLYMEAHPFVEETRVSDFTMRILKNLYPMSNDRLQYLFDKECAFQTAVNRSSVETMEFESNLIGKDFRMKTQILQEAAMKLMQTNNPNSLKSY